MGDRFISAQFCDDIRQEIAGKFSLIGCYGSSMVVDPLPSVLPKLGVAIKVYTPVDRPFQKLAVRVLRGDSPIAETPFDAAALAQPPAPHPPGVRWHMVGAMIVMSPFPIEEPCKLTIEAETEEGLVHGGSFWIHGSESKRPAVESRARHGAIESTGRTHG